MSDRGAENTRRTLTRRALLGSATAVAAVAVTGTAAGAQASAATPRPEVPDLWREFTRTPYTHPQIPYIGRAGRGAGAAHFPR
ncbi:hypothetical protein ACFVH5_43340, partial [Streptomyces sp. NPDC127119]